MVCIDLRLLVLFFFFLVGFLPKALGSRILGNPEQVQQAIKEPFSVPATTRDASLEIHFARNFDFYPSFSNETLSYNDIYGDKADVGILVDLTYYLINTSFISVGPTGGVGIIIDKASGRYEPNNFVSVPSSEARESYHFAHIPAHLGIGATLGVLKYLVPFGSVSGLAMGVYEKRTSDGESHRGLGWGVTFHGGLSLWLNFLERAAAWFLDYDNSINNTYLMVSFRSFQTFGELSYQENIYTAGMLLEF